MKTIFSFSNISLLSKLSIYLVSVFFIAPLAIWWTYLLLKISKKLKEIPPKLLLSLNLQDTHHYFEMIKWEGAFFLLAISLLIFILMSLVIRDYKKNKQLQLFYASLSHELKTPITSIMMQSEFLQENLQEDLPIDKKEKNNLLLQRLLEDTKKLDIEFDKILQLTRVAIERKEAKRSLINIERYLQSFFSQKYPHLEVKINKEKKKSYYSILAEESSLHYIFTNLAENTIRHSQSNQIDISLYREEKPFISLSYFDHGPPFFGDIQRLGQIFYKFNSKKGHGIGLYLIKNLMHYLKGSLKVKIHQESLLFILKFEEGIDQ